MELWIRVYNILIHTKEFIFRYIDCIAYIFIIIKSLYNKGEQFNGFSFYYTVINIFNRRSTIYCYTMNIEH